MASRLRLSLLLALSACLFPDISGLSGDAATLDAAGDSPSIPDGGDASADAPTGRWCASHTPDGGVCFDYDEPDAATTMSDLACQEDGGCTVTLAPAPDTDSPPNALVASVPALQPYPAYALVRAKFLTGGAQTATIAFDMRITTTGTVAGILGMFEWGTVIYSLDLAAMSFNLRASDYAPDSGVADQVYTGENPIDLSAWHRYSLTVSASAKTVSLTVDGVTVISDTTRSVPLTGGVAFTWGVDYINGPISPIAFHYDNVVLLAR